MVMNMVKTCQRLQALTLDSNTTSTQMKDQQPLTQLGQTDDIKGLKKVNNDVPMGACNAACLDDFELIRAIGRGSYAKVMMARRKETNRLYAMKVIKKELLVDDGDIGWIQTEKNVFEVASHHPFLVGLHWCFQTKARLFFVVDFVGGGDLMFHMQRVRLLEESHARFYAAEISCALDYLHEKGIIYRDLKLDNILLDADGHVKLTDYGMCKDGLVPGQTTATFCGTPNYIAPEILRGEDYDECVDWWALGVVLFEMLSGRSPFDFGSAADNPDQHTEDFLFQVILDESIRIPRLLSTKASSCLKGFLNKNPRERLGCRTSTTDPDTPSGFKDIQGHIFFKSIDWETLAIGGIKPPFKPNCDDESDMLSNFDGQFTSEPAQLTPDDDSLLQLVKQSDFEGFDFVNESLHVDEISGDNHLVV